MAIPPASFTLAVWPGGETVNRLGGSLSGENDWLSMPRKAVAQYQVKTGGSLLGESDRLTIARKPVAHHHL